MPAKLSSASFELGITAEPRAKGVERNQPDRFTIVVLGDFTGRANRGAVEPLAARKLRQVDCDSFERVLASLGAGLKLPDPASRDHWLELKFASLEDFHPDRLLAGAGPMTKLFDARRLLLNPSTAEQGKAALEAYLGAAIGGQSPAPAPTGPARSESDRQTFNRLLGGEEASEPKPAAPLSAAEQLIRKIVTPHVSPGSATGQQAALSAVDLELAKRLRALLHHADFQSLEAAWRGLDFLVRRIEAVEEIPVFLLDISATELESEVLGPQPMSQSPLFRALRDGRASLLVGNFTFGKSAADIRALAGMAGIAAALGAPFIATADPRMVGSDSFGRHPDPDDWKTGLSPDADAAWQALRKAPAASFVGLAAPRFLSRQPYGRTGDAIESFPFEELPGAPAHEDFLWGHPGILCASVLVGAYQTWLENPATAFAPPAGGEVGDLPAHKFTEQGETVIQPYAEAWLTERAANRMIAGGIIPMLSRKDSNGIQIPALPSVASPPSTLSIPCR